MNLPGNKEIKTYLGAALICLLFGLIYERFSHQVFSGYMVFAFLIPLLGGAAPAALLARVDRMAYPGPMTRRLWGSGIAALTVGSLYKGVLDIYGTTNRLSGVYWAAGALLTAAALGMYVVERAEEACRRK